MKKQTNFEIFINAFLKFLFGIISFIFFPLKVEGKENLPEEGPYIIAANHSSFADPPLISISIRPVIRWISHYNVYDVKLLKAIHEVTGCIRTNGTVKKALAALEEKDVVGIFPEGTRSFDGKLCKAGTGVAVIALKSGAPVVPVGVSGAFKAYPRGVTFPRRHRVLVKIGRPIKFERHQEDIIKEEALEKATDLVMQGIGELLVDI